MKGRSLQELAVEVERQREAKRDFIVGSFHIRLLSNADGRVFLELQKSREESESFGILPLFHQQMSAGLDIPRSYYSRMLAEAPDLLTGNVNHWLMQERKRRLVRTLDGDARAFLSDRYPHHLENSDMAEVMLPVIAEKECRVVSAEITERNLYIKAVSPRTENEVQVGDIVQAGVLLSNSEVGLGAWRIEPFIWRLICLNGAIAEKYSSKKIHLGSRTAPGEINWSDETIRTDQRALLLASRDAVSTFLSPAFFATMVAKMRQASEQKIEGNPVDAVEVVASKCSLSRAEKTSVLQHLIQGGDLSAYGMMNAVTATSNTVEDYDRGVELQRLGWDILELTPPSWRDISQGHLPRNKAQSAGWDVN